MTNLEFLDTNVLLYAYDTSAGHRHEAAAVLVGRLGRERRASVSIQVLQEFHVNATLKIAVPLSVEESRTRLRAFSRWTVHTPLPDDVLAAVVRADEHQLSFWDAMIVGSAAALGCTVLHTEDLNAGQVIDGVKVVNPFIRT